MTVAVRAATPRARDQKRDVRGGGLAGSAVIVMNLATYGFTMSAARMLGPRPYGGVAAVMNVLLVVSVLSLALQAATARGIAARPERAVVIASDARVLGARSGWAAAILLALAAPVLTHLLRLGGLESSLLLAAAVVPTTVMGSMAGILQGQRRWRALAALYLAAGLPRFVLGGLFMLAHPSEAAAVSGVAIAAIAPVVAGRVALGPRSRAEAGRDTPDGPRRPGPRLLWWETARDAQALLAFFLVSNLDILMARAVLVPHESGLYAGGVILTKAVTFAPQVVVVLAFPSMGTERTRRAAVLSSLGLTTAMGLVAASATWLLPGIALALTGGNAYLGIQGELWQFAMLGTVLAVVQLLVYSVLADRARWTGAILWVGLGVLALATHGAPSTIGLLHRTLLVDTALLGLLLTLTGWRLRRPVRLRQRPLGTRDGGAPARSRTMSGSLT